MLRIVLNSPALRVQTPTEEIANEASDLLHVRLESEMAGVEQVHFSVGDIATSRECGGERDGVLHREPRARADREMRGM